MAFQRLRLKGLRTQVKLIPNGRKGSFESHKYGSVMFLIGFNNLAGLNVLDCVELHLLTLFRTTLPLLQSMHILLGTTISLQMGMTNKIHVGPNG